MAAVLRVVLVIWTIAPAAILGWLAGGWSQDNDDLPSWWVVALVVVPLVIAIVWTGIVMLVRSGLLSKNNVLYRAVEAVERVLLGLVDVLRGLVPKVSLG